MGNYFSVLYYEGSMQSFIHIAILKFSLMVAIYGQFMDWKPDFYSVVYKSQGKADATNHQKFGNIHMMHLLYAVSSQT